MFRCSFDVARLEGELQRCRDVPKLFVYGIVSCADASPESLIYDVEHEDSAVIGYSSLDTGIEFWCSPTNTPCCTVLLTLLVHRETTLVRRVRSRRHLPLSVDGT